MSCDYYIFKEFFRLWKCNDRILLETLKSKQNLGLGKTLCPDFVGHPVCPHNDPCGWNYPAWLSSLYPDHCTPHSRSPATLAFSQVFRHPMLPLCLGTCSSFSLENSSVHFPLNTLAQPSDLSSVVTFWRPC